jgi:hypothetical protein
MDCDNPLISPTILDRSRTSHRIWDREIAALQEQGFPFGLAKTLTKNNDVFPLRIWVIDNSDSMRILDGHTIVENSSSYGGFELAKCSRWSEIRNTVEYHCDMAHLLQAPTIFRLLNDPKKLNSPQIFSIGVNDTTDSDDEFYSALRAIKTVSPSGVTPLSDHIREIRKQIISLTPTLWRDETQVVIVLATDGLPSDINGRCDSSTRQEFLGALRTLEGLPVWVVIRLCTDEDDVVGFYNDLDMQLELTIEVLDDFSQEAKEVYTHNPWLNYALPLHRCREMGYHNQLFDILDERRLGFDEIRELFIILFGPERFDNIPNPKANWKGFLNGLSSIVQQEKEHWNPVSKRLSPWIDIEMLDNEYKKNGKCVQS